MSEFVNNNNKATFFIFGKLLIIIRSSTQSAWQNTSETKGNFPLNFSYSCENSKYKTKFQINVSKINAGFYKCPFSQDPNN